jgi:hypothetical protein
VTRRGLLAGFGLLGGCAEMRQPPPASRVPAGLGVVSADPLPAIGAEAAAALADRGRALNGNPAATARTIGRMEFMLAELRRDPRWAPVSVGATTELRTAQAEWRAALGIRAGAPPEAVAAALGRTTMALSAGDARMAAGMLDATIFDPGAAVTLARLAAPGPLPQSAIASGLLHQEVERLRQLRIGGPIGALDPDAGFVGALTGGMPPAP